MQGGSEGLAASERCDEAIDRARVGVEAAHGLAVEVEVAGDIALRVGVGFFAEHNFVDEAGGARVFERQPGDDGWAKLPLQALEQRHEIPDGKYMVLHEDAQGLGAAQVAVERMFEQRLAKWGDGGVDLVERHG